jgi:hypothetical protein
MKQCVLNYDNFLCIERRVMNKDCRRKFTCIACTWREL